MKREPKPASTSAARSSSIRHGHASRRSRSRRREPLSARTILRWLGRHQRLTFVFSVLIVALLVAWIAVRLGSGD